MPCIPILSANKRTRVGFVCVGNDPVAVQHNGRTYQFEWTAASGWIAVNKDGSQRLAAVPDGAWDMLEATEEAARRRREVEEAIRKRGE